MVITWGVRRSPLAPTVLSRGCVSGAAEGCPAGEPQRRRRCCDVALTIAAGNDVQGPSGP